MGRLISMMVSGAVLSALTACSSVPELPEVNVPGIYRLDIQQGNVLNEESLTRLELGMNKRKVRFLLGTPAVNDVFHDDRWDYVYSYSRGRNEPELKRVSLLFADDALAKIEGADAIASTGDTPDKAQTVVVNVPKGRSDGSIFGRFTRPFRQRAGAARATQAANIGLIPDDPRVDPSIDRDGR